MKRYPHIPDREYSFGMIFNVSNQLQAVLDAFLKPQGLTTKQWYLSVVVSSLFDSPPQLTEVAKTMNTSHQNVKVIAQKLVEKGHMRLLNDTKDERIRRLVLTEESKSFWQEHASESMNAINQIFEGITDEEMSKFASTLTKILGNLESMK